MLRVVRLPGQITQESNTETACDIEVNTGNDTASKAGSAN